MSILTPKGEVTIISGFACIGKTTAARELNKQPDKFNILDLDSADFKHAVYRGMSKEYIDKHWVSKYVDNILENKEILEANENAENLVQVICVSAHQLVRDELIRRGVKFLYVYPSEEMFKIVLANSAARVKAAEGTDKYDSAYAAHEALAKHGMDFINDAITCTNDYEYQVMVELCTSESHNEFPSYLTDIITGGED